jgi:hypothetical protein
MACVNSSISALRPDYKVNSTCKIFTPNALRLLKKVLILRQDQSFSERVFL